MTPSSPKTVRSQQGRNDPMSINNIINIGVLNIKSEIENTREQLNMRKKLDFTDLGLHKVKLGDSKPNIIIECRR
jgi:hypothetical protein